MNAEVVKQTFDLREEVFKKVLEETKEMPRIVQIAKCLAAFLMEKPVYVSQDELLVGNAQFCNCAYSAPANFREEIEKYEKQAGVSDNRLYIFEAGLNAKLYQRGQGGHVIAGYEDVLYSGIGPLIEHAKECAGRSTGAAHDLAKASLIVCTALSDYIKRYAVEARRQDVNHLADICDKLVEKPPESFHEAVQLLWFLHEVVIYEQYCGSMSLGRLDVILFKFYEKDLEKGILDRSGAWNLIEAFFKKLGGLRRGYQNVTLGGSDDYGRFVDNDITRICLEVSKNLMIDQPLLSMRYAPDMSDDLWDDVLGLMQTGIGFPAMFNDSVAIQSKISAGIPESDAKKYGIIGCVEVAVPGKEFAHTEGLRINWAKIMELMLNKGKCQFTGCDFELSKRRDLASIKSFEEFYEWYKSELIFFLTLALEVTNTLDESYGRNWPTPYMSSLMHGCVKKGKDVNAGGAVYNLTSVNGCGMANAVDSLCAVRKVVFEEHMYTLPQLADILLDNFENAKALQNVLEKACPKFGNDDDEADVIMKELTDMFCHTINQYKNPRGGSFQSGLYSVDHHAHMGKLTGALPDGRNAGESLANGFSPCQGADICGPTALLKSITKNNLSLLGNGMVLDLKFNPVFFEKNKFHIRKLIETYFKLGGYEIQFNVIDKNTLLEAQKHPERHRNLIVRVSGFSAYFVDLDAVLQNEIIERSEHS